MIRICIHESMGMSGTIAPGSHYAFLAGGKCNKTSGLLTLLQTARQNLTLMLEIQLMPWSMRNIDTKLPFTGRGRHLKQNNLSDSAICSGWDQSKRKQDVKLLLDRSPDRNHRQNVLSLEMCFIVGSWCWCCQNINNKNQSVNAKVPRASRV